VSKANTFSLWPHNSFIKTHKIKISSTYKLVSKGITKFLPVSSSILELAKAKFTPWEMSILCSMIYVKGGNKGIPNISPTKLQRQCIIFFYYLVFGSRRSRLPRKSMSVLPLENLPVGLG
jgi:hypothetical protein